MRRFLFALLGALAVGSASGAELNVVESRWLQGAMPVLRHAKAAGLPLDVVVQPQAAAGLPPLALAFVDGRCKLVLSLRGNPAAEATLESIEPGLRDAALELMAAHEVGHCLRHVSGRWHERRGGSAPIIPAALPAERREDYARMHATRLEEAFGDLAGLAWIGHARPAQYDDLYRWLLRERATDLPGSHHDTLAWLRLVPDRSVLAGATPFERVHELWQRGLPRAAD